MNNNNFVMTLNTVFEREGGEYIFGGVMHVDGENWCDGELYVYYEPFSQTAGINPASDMIYDNSVTVSAPPRDSGMGWYIVLSNLRTGAPHDIIFKDMRKIVIKTVKTGANQPPNRFMTMNTGCWQNVRNDLGAAFGAYPWGGNIQINGGSFVGRITDFCKFISSDFDLIRTCYVDDGPYHRNSSGKGWYVADIRGSLEDLANDMIENGRTGGTLTVRYPQTHIKQYNSDSYPTAELVMESTISFNGTGFTISSAREVGYNEGN